MRRFFATVFAVAFVLASDAALAGNAGQLSAVQVDGVAPGSTVVVNRIGGDVGV